MLKQFEDQSKNEIAPTELDLINKVSSQSCFLESILVSMSIPYESEGLIHIIKSTSKCLGSVNHLPIFQLPIFDKLNESFTILAHEIKQIKKGIMDKAEPTGDFSIFDQAGIKKRKIEACFAIEHKEDKPYFLTFNIYRTFILIALVNNKGRDTNKLEVLKNLSRRIRLDYTDEIDYNFHNPKKTRINSFELPAPEKITQSYFFDKFRLLKRESFYEHFLKMENLIFNPPLVDRTLTSKSFFMEELGAEDEPFKANFMMDEEDDYIAEVYTPEVKTKNNNSVDTSEDCIETNNYIQNKVPFYRVRESSYFKYNPKLFNKLEREWLFDSLDKEPAVFQFIISLVLFLDISIEEVLSVSTSSFVRHESLLCYKKIIPRDFNLVDSDLYHSTTTELFLPLPTKVRFFLDSKFEDLKQKVTLKNLLSIEEQVMENILDSFFKKLREEHTSRFKVNKLKSQFRHFVTSETKDEAFVFMIFGTPDEGHPISTSYRSMNINSINNIFSDLTNQFFLNQ